MKKEKIYCVDTHNHLYLKSFDADRDQVIARAEAAGVYQMIVLGTHVASSRKALELAERYPNVFAAAGIHPSDAHQVGRADYIQIREMIQNASPGQILAVGETGLDFYWDRTYPEAQYQNFREMLNMAREFELPIVIHNRSAHREMQWFFQEEHCFEVRGVMHCFSGELIDVRFYLEMGLHISFSANITHSNWECPEVIKAVPLDRLLIETDAPYIPPLKFRKQRNEPAYVVFVVEKLAEIYKKSVAEIMKITTDNSKRLFKLPAVGE